MIQFLKNIGPLEAILYQVIFYLGFWLLNDYLAFLITCIFVSIFFGILIISLISEWLEKSKVPRIYFIHLAIATMVPFVILLYFLILDDWKFSWFLD